MAEIITMPRLSDTMTEGKVAKWDKKVGDTVKEGDVLAEIETDKAVQDFESEINGTLLYIGVEEGQSSPVDAILAIIGKAGEDISSLIGGGASAPAATATETKEEPKQEAPATTAVEIPAGIEVITVPRLSDTMTEGKVAKWDKKVGETVKEGDVLAEIETDKAVQDFESEVNGTLLYIGVEEGQSAPVDSILAIIGAAGTDVSAVVAGFGKGGSTTTAPATSETTSNAPKVEETKTVNTVNAGGRIFASPLAKKIAKDKGIDLSSVAGSGDNGRIVKKDVENFTPAAAAAPAQAESAAPKAAPVFVAPVVAGVDSETPNSQMRNIIAKRLSESKFTAPHYYLITEITMDNAMAARKTINSNPEVKISFNDMVIKAVAVALRKHPQVNSNWAGDKIIHHGNINIGVAVAIEDGLVVPVIKNTDFLGLSNISASVKDLAKRARDRKLKANEMEGSTFSVSNLGMFGVESFTSIINQPNSCILSVGAIIQKPVVSNGQIVVGNTMKVSLACDHRVVDGASGAAFLKTLKEYLENPVTLLV